MATKLILSLSKGYRAPAIRTWLKSACRHRDNYAVGLILFDRDPEILELCARNQVTVFEAFDDPTDVIQIFYYRCKLIAGILRRLVCDYVLLTDVKDVVFQADPFPRLIERMGDRNGLLTSENITISKEPWNWRVMREVFGPETAERLKDCDVINGGVLFGRPAFLAELNSLIWDISHGLQGEPIRDQAALDYLYYTYNLIRQQCVVATGEDTIVAHLGVAGPTPLWELWNFKDNLKCGHARLDPATCQVVNHRGEPYPIVHQYDRVAGWVDAIKNLYAGERGDPNPSSLLLNPGRF